MRYTALLLTISNAIFLVSAHSEQFMVQWDNDLLTGTDDGYTNGARIALAKELSPDSDQHNLLQNTLRRLTGAERGGAFSDFRFPDEGDLRFQYGTGLTQLMFTPGISNALTPPNGERPYAGWLGLEFSLQASAGNSASTVTLSVGTTGRSSYAQEAQDWVHRNISDSPIFQGWDSQAPAELTINLHFDHKHRLAFLDHTRDWPIELDGFYEWGGALGNFRTNAYIGALMRAGYNLPSSYTTPRVQLGSFTASLFDDGRSPNQNFSLYGFSGLRAYAVLHDITLNGPLFSDWDESVDPEPLVGELSFGVAARWRWAEVSLSHTLRTDEFKGQNNRSLYGSVLVKIDVSY
ncbi:lipid A deacylase LpxR family protein [Coraliomargarita sp. W4R72]